ncbi:AAA family ATPase [Paenibacillus sp. HB172176]|uniref:AAA family ATPase n=1 Tax=Paenibacillus sp. HB172176 TaxID=2493690 RepID=UPI00143BB75C|nr:AAA family ATPase [Paenibacillus sp. HB172176]
MKNTIYIISGPAGAGKSTTSKQIATRLGKSAYIEGDLIDHMVIGGHEKPWLSQYHTDLIWRNIEALTKNFIKEKHDVIIDYVAFPWNARRISEAFANADIVVKYAVLIVEEAELLRRDAERKPEHQMGPRSVAGLHEILESKPGERHVLNTTSMDVETVIHEIMTNERFVV